MPGKEGRRGIFKEAVESAPSKTVHRVRDPGRGRTLAILDEAFGPDLPQVLRRLESLDDGVVILGCRIVEEEIILAHT